MPVRRSILGGGHWLVTDPGRTCFWRREGAGAGLPQTRRLMVPSRHVGGGIGRPGLVNVVPIRYQFDAITREMKTHIGSRHHVQGARICVTILRALCSLSERIDKRVGGGPNTKVRILKVSVV